MPDRRDYLPVCNDQGVPLPEFEALFCVRCVQPECSRSKAGGLFEARVSTWKDRLFDNPLRMPKDDPLYAAISAKRFIEIDTGRIPEIGGRSEWVDPRGLEQPAPQVSKPRAARKAPAQPPNVPPVSERQEGAPRVLNTAFQQGAVLGSPPTSPKAPSADPWAPPAPVGPEPASPAVPQVKAGARIRFT